MVQRPVPSDHIKANCIPETKEGREEVRLIHPAGSQFLTERTL